MNCLIATSAILALVFATGVRAQTSEVDIVGGSNALDTVAQRHVVRIQPSGHGPVLFMAVQNSGYSNQRYGLLWYRSNDEGATWSYYRDAIASPDPATYDSTLHPSTLHLAADLIVVGNDIAAVYSYDTTSSGFPADAWDPKRVIYFQWWQYDGVNDWTPGTRITVGPVSGTQAYHRAEIARDSAGRLWVQAFLRQNDCPTPGQTACLGDLLNVWYSTDGGATFQGPQTLATLTHDIGGGRLISLGSNLMMLWGHYIGGLAAQMRMRNDADPPTTWSAVANAFPDSAPIYHGAALNAAEDGIGGLHLVYKEYIGPNDEQQLYYRYYNGTSFGAKQAVDAIGDWALQPAITTVGNDLFVCLNHMITTNANYEMRLYKKSAGWGSFQSIDTLVMAKAYPTALEAAPPNPAFLPCAFGTGDPNTWGSGHDVKVTSEPIAPDYSLSANPTQIEVLSGASGSSTITMIPVGGFNSSVTLSASGVPGGATLTFSPNPVAAGGSSTATFNSGTASPNTYQVSVNGSGGGVNRSTPLQCRIDLVGNCAPLTDCGGQCVNTSNDPNNCGGCNIVCSGPPSHGFPVCSGSSCAIGCNSGYHTCDGSFCTPDSQQCP